MGKVTVTGHLAGDQDTDPEVTGLQPVLCLVASARILILFVENWQARFINIKTNSLVAPWGDLSSAAT
jgi:hypothetical protein